MLTVGLRESGVESELAAGRLRCPGCGAVLAPWGHARRRVVRGRGTSTLVLRPRRARCSGCSGTHVLLPVCCLLRRADAVTVIGAALLAKATGVGHRRIAADLARPASTVRGWLRRMAVVAGRVRSVLGGLAAELGAEFIAQGPAGGPVAEVVALVGALAAGVTRRLGRCEPWRLVSAATGGLLLAPDGPAPPGVLINTSWLWAGPV